MKVSLCVVALNEEQCLPKLFKDFRAQTYEHDLIEIVLVDSASTDKTKALMEEFKKSKHNFYSILIADNPKKIQAAGWNIVLSKATGDVIIRIDGHARIPADFVQNNINVIGTGQYICGGKVSNSSGSSLWSETVNLAENSMFGGSFACFRRCKESCYVSTLAFAAYRRKVFDVVGSFDERLVRTEDNEMHYRMREAGFRFYYDPVIQSCRESRSSLLKLLKQKYMNGYWIGLTMGICPKCFSLYHFIPLCFFITIIVTNILAFCGQWQITLLFWGFYILCVIAMVIIAIYNNKFNMYQFLLPIIFFLLHINYGIGTFVGIIRMLFTCRKYKFSEIK